MALGCARCRGAATRSRVSLQARLGASGLMLMEATVSRARSGVSLASARRPWSW
jgi:hypothetical protein